jgi:hypothetical protein
MTERPPVLFLDAPKPCAECGEPTITKKVGPRMRQALHVSCDKRLAEELDDREFVGLLSELAGTLGHLRAVPTPLPTFPEVGPCLKCFTPTRRYGPHGSTRCHHCDPRKPRMSDQLPLFPIVVCGCGHRYPGIGTLDPCPACLTSPDDEHDCPLREEAR